MKKILIIFLIFCCTAVFADETPADFFTPEELTGIWQNKKWPETLREAMGFVDVGEHQYETVYFFSGNHYEFLASDDKYLLYDDVKVHNINDYRLESYNPRTQWIAFYVSPDWQSLGISKITPETSVRKEIDGQLLIDLQPGDMILTYYSKEWKIVYRKQFRKVTSQDSK